MSFVVPFIVALLAVQHSEQNQLRILPTGPKVQSPENQPLLLTCEGVSESSSDFSNFMWKSPKGDEIGENSEFYLRHDTGKLALIFTNPKAQDSGIYQCQAESQHSGLLNVSVDVFIFRDIYWDNCPTEQALTKDTFGFISCKVSGSPMPKIEWRKDGKIIGENHRWYIHEDTVLRTRNPVRDEDAGIYEIMAYIVNTASLHFRRITVTIIHSPTMDQTGDVVEVIIGEKAELTCSASASPLPVYYWYNEEGHPLVEDENYFADSVEGLLTIWNVSEDDVKFKCVAQNAVGKAEKIVTLKTITKPSITRFLNETAVENQPINLLCEAEGIPLPSIQFKGFYPTLIDSSKYSLEIESTENSSLTKLRIKNVRAEDAGPYICLAKSKAGFDEKLAHLEVQYSPRLSTGLAIVKLWDDKTVNLSCIVDAFPSATVEWFHNGSLINNSLYYTIYSDEVESRLFINPVNDTEVYGSYTCKATNVHNSSELEISVVQIFRPGVPEKVIFSCTSNSVKFRIASPVVDGGSPIFKYLIKFKHYVEPPVYFERVLYFNDQEEQTIEDLLPNTTYGIQLAAGNEVGFGEFSQEHLCKTLRASKPCPPIFKYPMDFVSQTGGDLIADDVDMHTVSWESPDDNGDPIDWFELKYYKVIAHSETYLFSATIDELPEWKRIGPKYVILIAFGPETDLSYDISSLDPDTHYAVEIKAHNSLGYSIPSFLVFKTRARDPPSVLPSLTGCSTSRVNTLLFVCALLVYALLSF